jgi:hypothetical protein
MDKIDKPHLFIYNRQILRQNRFPIDLPTHLPLIYIGIPKETKCIEYSIILHHTE